RWRREGLEALFREGAAGGCLQVLLESEGLLFVAEGNVGLEPPRSVLRRVWHFARVVLLEPSTQVVRDADVEVLGIETFEDVDVFHGPPAVSYAGRIS